MVVKIHDIARSEATEILANFEGDKAFIVGVATPKGNEVTLQINNVRTITSADNADITFTCPNVSFTLGYTSYYKIEVM